MQMLVVMSLCLLYNVSVDVALVEIWMIKIFICRQNF